MASHGFAALRMHNRFGWLLDEPMLGHWSRRFSTGSPILAADRATISLHFSRASIVRPRPFLMERAKYPRRRPIIPVISRDAAKIIAQNPLLIAKA
jgi:hypothetical protein